MDKIRRPKPVKSKTKEERPSLTSYLKQRQGTQWKHVEREKCQKRRFLGFHEQLKRIDVKLAHNPDRVLGLEWKMEEEREEELLTSRSSYFINSLNSHNLMNTSLAYRVVSQKLAPLSATFPMVVHNLREILSVLLDHIHNSDQHCANAILDFLVALIKDTRSLIFPSFLSSILPALVQLIDVRQVELLDHIFITISYAFKFLQRQMLERVGEVYCHFLDAREGGKYVRKFAAESCSFLLRSCKRGGILQHVDALVLEVCGRVQVRDCVPATEAIEILHAGSQSADEALDRLYQASATKEVSTAVYALSQLMYEVIAGTQGNAHSKGPEFLQALYSGLVRLQALWLPLFYVCRYTTLLLVEYLDPANDACVLQAMRRAFPELHEKLFAGTAGSISGDEELVLNMLLVLYKDWATLRGGKKMSDGTAKAVVKGLNHLACGNPAVFSTLQYTTKANVVQCLALLYATKTAVVSDHYQLQLPFPSTDKLNLLKHSLFAMQPHGLLCGFLKVLYHGHQSNLQLAQFPSDIPFIHKVSFVPREDQLEALIAPLLDNYQAAALAMLSESAIDPQALSLRLLYLIRMAGTVNYGITVRSKEDKDALIARFMSSEDELMQCVCLDLISCFSDIVCSPALEKRLLDYIRDQSSAKWCDLGSLRIRDAYSGTALEMVLKCFTFSKLVECRSVGVSKACTILVRHFLGSSSGRPQALRVLSTLGTEMLPNSRNNVHLLKALNAILDMIKPEDVSQAAEDVGGTEAANTVRDPQTKNAEEHHSLHSTLQHLRGTLVEQLCSNLRSVRLMALTVLSGHFGHKCGIAEQLLEIEKMEVGIETEREKMTAFRDLKLALSLGQTCEECLRACVYYACGTIWAKFSVLHTAAEDLLFVVLEKYAGTRMELMTRFIGVAGMILQLSHTYCSHENIGQAKVAAASCLREEMREAYWAEEDFVDFPKLSVAIIRMMRKVVGLDQGVASQALQLFSAFAQTEFKTEIFFCPIPESMELREEAAVGEDEIYKLMEVSNPHEDETEVKLREMSRLKMVAFLEVLAEISDFTELDPGAAGVLQRVSLHLISSPEEKTQALAVQLQGALGNSVVKSHMSTLLTVANRIANKDVLLNLELGSTKSKEEREELLELVVKLFFGKLVKKKGRREKTAKRDLMPSIFGLISMWQEDEVLKAIRTILSTYRIGPTNTLQTLASLTFTKMRGLCYTIKLIVRYLGRHIDHSVPIIGDIIVSLLQLSLIWLNRSEINYRKFAHTIYADSVKRLKEVYKTYGELPELAPISSQFIKLVTEKIHKMRLEQAQGKSNILGIFVEWSSNPALQSLFSSHPFIVDSIFELLALPKLSPEVATALFQILHNLLYVKNESLMSETKRVCDELLRSKTDYLVSQTHAYLALNPITSTICSVLSELIPYVSGAQPVLRQLMDILIPHMLELAERPRRNSSAILVLIRILKLAFAKCPASSLEYFNQFSKLLLKLCGFEARCELSELLAILSESDPELQKSASSVIAMNRFVYRGTELEPDFEQVIKQINEVNQRMESPIDVSRATPVVYQLLHNASNEDYSVRAASVHGLKLFIVHHLKETSIEFITRNFFPSIRQHLRNKDEIVLRGVFDVIKCYVTAVSALESEDEGMHKDLKCLLNQSDEEQDFFSNIVHVQLHRRFKALRMAASAVRDGLITSSTMLNVLLPLANSFLVFQEGSKEKEDGKSLKKKAAVYKKSGYARQIVADATELIGAIIPHLLPDQYFGLLRRYVVKLPKSRDSIQAVYISVVCKLLDCFPFEVPDAVSQITAELSSATAPLKEALQDLQRHPKPVAERLPTEVFELLKNMKRVVFPVLRDCLNKQSKESKYEEGEHHRDINPAIALALLRVIRKLGVKQYLQEFSRTSTLILGPLRSKDPELRDKARSVLYDATELISPYTLHVWLEELIIGLTKDYQRHVLLFTVHGIIHRIVKSHSAQFAGCFDYFLDTLLPLIMKGVTGELFEESETEEVVRRCKEAKDNKSADLFGLVAQLIDVNISIEALIGPIVEELERTSSVKIVHRCELALSRVVDGLLKNPSLSWDRLVSVASGLLDKSFAMLESTGEEGYVEEKRRETLKELKAASYVVQEGAAAGARISMTRKVEVKNELASGKAICFFALSLVFHGLSRQILPLPRVAPAAVNAPSSIAFEPELASPSRLAPLEHNADTSSPPPDQQTEWSEELVNYVIRALKSQYVQLVQIALRIYDRILNRDIRQLRERSDELLQHLIKQFDYFNMGDKELVHCIFRCVTHMVEAKGSSVKLEKPQVKSLLQLIKSNMREAECEVQVFRCIRAIVNSGMRFKKLEELVNRAAEVMLTSAWSKSIREICGGIFVDYVEKYAPVNSGKFNEKLQFLLRNLGYERDEAREYLLQVLKQMVSRALPEADAKLVDTIFVSLVLRLANEDSTACKKQVVELLELLIGHGPIQKQLLSSVFLWLENALKLALKSSCFQLLGSFVRVMGESYAVYAKDALRHIHSVLQSAADAVTAELQDETEEINEELRPTMKLVGLVEETKETNSRQDWLCCYMALNCLEKHFALRGHFAKLINSDAGLEVALLCGKLLRHRHHWIKLSACRVLGHLFSVQSGVDFAGADKDLLDNHFLLFRSRYLDEPLSVQASKNVLFIVRNSGEGACESVLRKFTKLGKSIIGAETGERARLLPIVKLIGGVALSVGEAELKSNLVLFLSLLYRLHTNEEYKGTEVSKMSTEIMDAIASRAGMEKFTEALTELKAEIQKTRLQRKRKEKELRIAQPEVAIKSKVNQKLKEKAKRKRKNQEWADRRKGLAHARPKAQPQHLF